MNNLLFEINVLTTGNFRSYFWYQLGIKTRSRVHSVFANRLTQPHTLCSTLCGERTIRTVCK